jgi:hypothetical protein
MPDKSPFYVGHEAGHADVGEAFRQALQGDGLAGAGGPRDEAVAVGHGRQQEEFGGIVLGGEQGDSHGTSRHSANVLMNEFFGSSG